MRPEQDPDICAALETAVRDIAARSRNAAPSPSTPPPDRDPGHASPRIVARLAGLVKRYGFTMSRSSALEDLGRQLGGKVLGGTMGSAWPGPDRLTVRLSRGMTPASETRVAAHETAHVILGHTGLTLETSIDVLMKRLENQCEDPHEETAAELAAGAFCQLARIGTSRLSPEFIWEKLRGQTVPEDDIQAGVLGARILWAAARPALEAAA